jgi:GT2 family glycosyltransferase
MQTCQLSVCLVPYGMHKRDTFNHVTASLASLKTSVVFAKEQTHAEVPRLEHVGIWIVCNDESPDIGLLKESIIKAGWQAELENGWVTLIAGQGNVGFAKANNVAIFMAESQYHLVLNPDVLLAQDAIWQAWSFAHANPSVGLMSPSVVHEDGSKQYLCRRDPSILTLLLRGFAPSWVKKWFKTRLDQYEMRDVMLGREDKVYFNPRWVSGAFMWFDMSILKQLGGFYPQFFLYFEDTDLSYRAAAVTQIAYVPQIKMMHFGGNAAKKGWKHIVLFARSAALFFRLHGWRWW